MVGVGGSQKTRRSNRKGAAGRGLGVRSKNNRATMDTGGGGSLGRVKACVAPPAPLLMYSDAKCARLVAPIHGPLVVGGEAMVM